MSVLQNVIGGVSTPSTGALFDLVSPVTGEVYGQASISTVRW